MKTPPTQFDVRENTASPRRHDLRLATDVRSKLIHPDEQDINTRLFPHEDESQEIHSENQLHAAQQRAATEERAGNQLLTVREVAEMLRVPVSWVYGRMRKRSREQLPAYRLGKYWRFREEEILAWVRRQRGGQHVA
ncbi:MAG TPA: helix-turn-helix domain-containing protein [Candidatus Acidoferrum sp.]|nr:helix-turn-helix domain-containing protein [Candidatus Acidoferrum sp.]